MNVTRNCAPVHASTHSLSLSLVQEPELDPVEDDDEEDRQINEELQKAAIALLDVLKVMRAALMHSLLGLT